MKQLERPSLRECGFVPETKSPACSAQNKDLLNNKQIKDILKKEKVVAGIFKNYRIKEIVFAPFGFDRTGKEMYPNEKQHQNPQLAFRYKIEYELSNGFIQTYCFNI